MDRDYSVDNSNTVCSYCSTVKGGVALFQRQINRIKREQEEREELAAAEPAAAAATAAEPVANRKSERGSSIFETCRFFLPLLFRMLDMSFGHNNYCGQLRFILSQQLL